MTVFRPKLQWQFNEDINLIMRFINVACIINNNYRLQTQNIFKISSFARIRHSLLFFNSIWANRSTHSNLRLTRVRRKVNNWQVYSSVFGSHSLKGTVVRDGIRSNKHHFCSNKSHTIIILSYPLFHFQKGSSLKKQCLIRPATHIAGDLLN